MAQGTNPTDVCKNCGAALGDGHDFCPKCGQKVGLAFDSGVSSAISEFNAKQTKKNKKKIVVPIVIVSLLAAGSIAAYIFFKPVLFNGKGLSTEPDGGSASISGIVLSDESFEMNKGDTKIASYTISPLEAAFNTEVTWQSSDESVAVVDDKCNVKAVGKGSCTITVSAEGKSDTLSVTVKSGPDFNEIFINHELDDEWVYLGSDGSYLTIDTNPDDVDDYSNLEAFLKVYEINDALGLPDSLAEKMGRTSALDGRQTESYDDLEVSWKYHPNRGLEITYEAK